MAKDTQPDLAGKLTFENDRGARRSKWIAGLLAILLVGWMGSGYILPSTTEEEAAAQSAQRAITVAVMPSLAKDVQLVLSAEGQSVPDRSTMVQAEAAGQVISVSANRGDLVAAGQEIGRVDAETLQAQLLQAQT